MIIYSKIKIKIHFGKDIMDFKEYGFMIAGGILSVVLYLFLLLKFNKKFERTAVYFVSFILSLIVSKIYFIVESHCISENMDGSYTIYYSYYISMILFVLFSHIINNKFSLNNEKTSKLSGAPLILFLCISKIGCYFNGCCFAVIGGRTIPLNLIESGLAFITLIFVMFNLIKPNLYLLTAFSLYRYITDFYKTSFEFENIRGITFAQILYVLVIIISITLIVKNYLKGRKNYEKN